jgi:hypothetical protein
LVIVHLEEGPNVKRLLVKVPKLSCTIRSLVSTLNKASYLGPFKILLLEHLAKCPTPTHRSLGLASMLMQMFGVENYMIIEAKKWGEKSIANES